MNYFTILKNFDAIFKRDQNRMGIPQESAIAVQNKIEVSPGTPMRPITQQGLTGVRGPSRFGSKSLS